MSFVVNKNWHKFEFRDAKVWDKRCIKSLSNLSNAILSKHGTSFSGACGASLRQCGTRIFSKESMEPEHLQSGHYKETNKRSIRANEVLVVQDTSSFNYTSHKSTTGLGHIGTDSKSRGINVHTCLVLRSDGLALGIIGQKLWTRAPEQIGKRHNRRDVPTSEKESSKWLDGLHYSNSRLSSKIEKIWVISDRESDVYDYMASQRQSNTDLLLRAVQPRIIEVELDNTIHRGKLHDIIKLLPEMATKTVEIDTSKSTESRELSISYSNIRLNPPKVRPKGLPVIPMTLIYAREKQGKDGHPIEWILLCSKQDMNKEEALKMIDFYTHRWKIERFHYTLKTGVFNVEDLQFDDASTLMNALSFYSILAWRVMYLTYYARLEAEAKAEELVDTTEKEILEIVTKKKISTTLDVLMAIGILGGFIGGNKKYPYPGIKILWLGFQILEAMKQGWILAKGHSE
jgi:hypothetical protein